MTINTATATLPPRNVLLIDDDHLIPLILGNTVRDSGFSVVSLTDASKLTTEHIDESDLVILDLMMPDIDGINIIQKLGKSHYPGGLILISGLGQDYLNAASMMADSFKLNVAGALQKPVDTTKLKTLLVKHSYSLLREGSPSNKEPNVSPEEVNTALRNNLIKTAVKMTVNVSDSTAIGGEIVSFWGSDSQYLDHDLLCKSASCDPATHNAYTYFMLQKAREVLRRNTTVEMEVSIRVPGIGVIKGLRDPAFVAFLRDASNQPGDFYISFDSEDVRTLGDQLLIACKKLAGLGVKTALDIQESRITKNLDLVSSPFSRVVLSHPSVTHPGYGKSLIKFLDFAKRKGLQTVLSEVDTLDILEQASVFGFNLVRPIITR